MWYDLFSSCLSCYICKFGEFISKEDKLIHGLYAHVFHLPEPYDIPFKILCICTLLLLWALSNFVTHGRYTLFTFLIKYTYTSNFYYRSALSHYEKINTSKILTDNLSLRYSKKERERENMACQRSMIQKKDREKMACQRSMTQKKEKKRERKRKK
jgi:hypothetical protein